MDSFYNPTESAPLQMERYNVPPVQPGAPPMVQHTTVNVSTEPPKDHIIWSLCCFFYFNPLCLGMAALIFSIKARDRKTVGDMHGARSYGSTAKQLNIAATVLVIIAFIIAIIVLSVVITKMQQLRYRYGYGF